MLSIRKRKICKIATILFVATPIIAQAATFGDSGGFILTDILQDLIDLITSKIGALFFTLSIIGIGYAWLKLGKIDKEPAIVALLGASLIFGAAWLCQYFGFGS